MVNKKDFFDHMSQLYQEDYSNDDNYKTLKAILKIKDKDQIKELQGLLLMNKTERLVYRSKLASYGRELTPRQLDQYLSTVEYALSHM